MENRPVETPAEKVYLSHYIQTKDKFGNPVNIPVIDVRDGLAERMLAESMLKASRSSKYIVYNRYHVSPKKVQTL